MYFLFSVGLNNRKETSARDQSLLPLAPISSIDEITLILVNSDGAGHGQCVTGGCDVEERSAASVRSVGPVKDRTGPSKFRAEIQ